MRKRHPSARSADPVLPLSPGRTERHGFEYFRDGILSLYAAFNTKTGEVLGKTAARHTSGEAGTLNRVTLRLTKAIVE
jgi:hypothetical protein